MSKGRIQTRIVSTVRDVPEGLWDEKIARGHPFKSSAFMACLEEAFPERRFGYVLMTKEDEPAGLAVMTEEPLDLGLLLPDMVSRLSAPVKKLRPGVLTVHLGMVGTFETAQRHWWVDSARVSESEFAAELLAALRTFCSRSALLLVRDFMEESEEDGRLEAQIVQRGFVRVANHPIATIKLNGLDIGEHLRRLKKKSRANVRKKLEQADQLGMKLERVTRFRGLVEECYPLYLQVHEKSSEFKRNPIPKSFFEALATRMPEETSFLVLRSRDDRVLAFILTGTSDTVSNPFLIGMDYASTRGTPAYYFMLWQEIEHAARRGCREVDLGLTSYFVKQTVGAELEGMSMAARLQSVWLRPLLQPLLPRLLSAEQPARRRIFRVAADIEPSPATKPH